MSRFGEVLKIPFYFWVVRGGGRTVLIDTGVSPEQAKSENENTVARFGKECAWIWRRQMPLRKIYWKKKRKYCNKSKRKAE